MRAGTREAIMLVAILLLATTLRLYALGKASLWYDEAMYGLLARAFTTKLLGASYILIEPLFLVMISLWVKLGESAFWFRLPSVVAGVLTVWVAVCIARAEAGERASRITGLVVACAPVMIYYSRDGKMYGWVILWVLLAAHFALAVLREPTCWRNHVAYAAPALALCYTYFGAPLYLGVSGVVVFVGLLRTPKPLLVWSSINALLILAALPFVLAEIRYGETMRTLLFHAKRPNSSDLLITFEHFFSAYTVSRPVSLAALVLVGGTTILGLLRSSGSRFARIYLLALGTLPVFMLYGLSAYAPWSAYIDRYVIACAGPLLVLAGLGLSRLVRMRLRVATLGVVLVLCAAALPDVYANRVPEDSARRKGLIQHLDMDSVVAAVATHAVPGDVFCHVFWETHPVFRWYLPAYPQILTDINGDLQRNLDSLTHREYQALFEWHLRPLATLLEPGMRIWLVVPQGEALRAAYSGMEATLRGRAKCMFTKSFGEGNTRISLTLYQVGASAPRNQQDYRIESQQGPILLSLITKGESVSFAVDNQSRVDTGIKYEAVYGDSVLLGSSFAPALAERSLWRNTGYLAAGITRMASVYRLDPKRQVIDPLSADVPLAPGSFVAFIYRTVQGTKYSIPAAQLDVNLDGIRLTSAGAFDDKPGGWEWQRLGTFQHIGTARVKVSVVASDPLKQPEAYGVFSQILLVHEATLSSNQILPPQELGVLSCAAAGKAQQALMKRGDFLAVSVSGVAGKEVFALTYIAGNKKAVPLK